MPEFDIIFSDCFKFLEKDLLKGTIHLTFLDPPFNQKKDYAFHDDNLPDNKYWELMKSISKRILERTERGGAIYFMQREKNAEKVISCLHESGWTLQNLIIWKKKTSAVPCANKFGKHYQIIAFATNGEKPRLFNKLKITPPLPENYKHERKNGVFVTDVWDDIRELTSGYFAGEEAIRMPDGERFHKQQTPIALLLRIILSSTKVGDMVFDPFAGTGTTLLVSYQLGRNSIGIEIDPQNVEHIRKRLSYIRKSDDVKKYYGDYILTENLEKIWGISDRKIEDISLKTQPSLFG